MDEQSEPKKRRGRPPKSAEDRKGGNLTFRVRDGMRERLEASARARGVSISEDVEKRIERTFDFDYLLGDNETALVLRSIGNAIRRFELASGKSWIQDSSTQAAVHEAVSKMVDALMAVHPVTDDRIKHDGPGLEIDWNDPETRPKRRILALDAMRHDLQLYQSAKETEFVQKVRHEGREYRAARRERVRAQTAAPEAESVALESQPLPELPHEVRAAQAKDVAIKDGEADLVHIAAALKNRTPSAAVGIGRVNDGPLVSEQGPDGVWRELLPKPRRSKRTASPKA